jgi:hypothetical protein
VAGVDPAPHVGTDRHVECVVEYLQKRQAASTALRPPVLSGPLKAINDALEIYLRGGPTRWALESAMLTEGLTRYAQTVSKMPLETVEAYAYMFFDVANRLDDSNVILDLAVWPRHLDSIFSFTDVDLVWKLFAYRGGPGVLEALIDDFVESGEEDYEYIYERSDCELGLSDRRRRVQDAVGSLLATYTSQVVEWIIRVDEMLQGAFPTEFKPRVRNRQ